MIQREVGKSSWFGFSLVLRKEANIQRSDFVREMTDLGFECRPIVGGNFAKNEVMKYFDYSIHGDLENADYIDQNGLFVGNHHYPIDDAVEVLTSV